jgi:hypothetical protein
MEALVPTILIFSFVPSILRTWRSMLTAALSIYLLALVTFFLAMRQLDTMTEGEGPAFIGIFGLFGLITVIVVSSCLSRLTMSYILSNLRTATVLLIRRTIAITGMLIITSALCCVFFRFLSLGLAISVGVAFVWLYLATWPMPNYAMKATTVE